MKNKKNMISGAGFEPALPKETDLESVALDHSANRTSKMLFIRRFD